MNPAATERFFHVFDTPLGVVRAVCDADGALVRLAFQDAAVDDGALPDPARGAAVERQVGEYFAGARRDFDLPLAPEGTDFQKRVWDALLRIPYGATCTYADLARRLGQPTATRAVGLANGANPLWLVVPCHRVVGSDGNLTGYAGGIDRKRALLVHEGALLL